MKIIPSHYGQDVELPFKLKISFESVFVYLEGIQDKPEHYLYEAANKILRDYKDLPILREGFSDTDYLNKYNVEIDRLMDILFPDLLMSNEIKAATIPFEFTTFKLSKRFEEIMDNAGDDYEITLRNYEESSLYILSCIFILGICYKVHVDFKRPFYYDIPDKRTGVLKSYRAMFNGDFFKVEAHKNAPKITKEDIEMLIDNFEDVDLWKEKFPPNSYDFKGFGMMNLFDVTADQSLSNLREDLLKTDEQSFRELELSISRLFNTNSIKFGFSIFSMKSDTFVAKNYNAENSYLVANELQLSCEGFFCDGILEEVFKNKELIAISDLEKYGEKTGSNKFSKILLEQGFQSVILVPIDLKDGMLGVMEVVSEEKHQLNSISAYKLKDVVPVFEVATQRYMEEFKNKLESIIQENYTSLHPTIKWKFYEQAEEYAFAIRKDASTESKLGNIIFEDVVPLFGQSDIRGSSKARNASIQKDLQKQLDKALTILNKSYELFQLPIYKDLIYRINGALENVKKELQSGDEFVLTDFLQKDIYPVFSHLKTLDPGLRKDIDQYMSLIDDKLQIIYDKRKEYEDSVNVLNERLAAFIDAKQKDAQKMFPHYFERYKTDGVEYNMYIGQSLVNNRKYNELYLFNLRLWQLQMMCEMEVLAYKLKNELPHPLEIASLVLVHSAPLSIKFRMDEKRFDVDGAYNIRYEIIKKRIDKALIKGTKERLTQPGKIAIVYSQNEDAKEYLKYIKHLQSIHYLTDEIENLKIEDLQGTTGLKALRVTVNFEKTIEEQVTFDEIMQVIKNPN